MIKVKTEIKIPTPNVMNVTWSGSEAKEVLTILEGGGKGAILEFGESSYIVLEFSHNLTLGVGYRENNFTVNATLSKRSCG